MELSTGRGESLLLCKFYAESKNCPAGEVEVALWQTFADIKKKSPTEAGLFHSFFYPALLRFLIILTKHYLDGQS
jgi:hypothetical protein